MPVFYTQLLKQHHHDSNMLLLPDLILVSVCSVQLWMHTLWVYHSYQLIRSSHFLCHCQLAVVVQLLQDTSLHLHDFIMSSQTMLILTQPFLQRAHNLRRRIKLFSVIYQSIARLYQSRLWLTHCLFQLPMLLDCVCLFDLRGSFISFEISNALSDCNLCIRDHQQSV